MSTIQRWELIALPPDRNHTILIRMDDFSLLILSGYLSRGVGNDPLVFHHFLILAVKSTHLALDPFDCDLALAKATETLMPFIILLSLFTRVKQWASVRLNFQETNVIILASSKPLLV